MVATEILFNHCLPKVRERNLTELGEVLFEMVIQFVVLRGDDLEPGKELLLDLGNSEVDLESIRVLELELEKTNANFVQARLRSNLSQLF